MSIKHITPWHVLLDEGEDGAEQTNDYRPHDEGLRNFAGGFSRRRFIRKAAGAVGATGLVLSSGLSMPVLADHEDDDDHDHDDDRDHNDDRDGDADDAASPLPIPGGTVLPFSTERYHFFFPPGTTAPVTIPATPGVVEPSLITNFRGFIGLSHVKGAGTGTNTETGVTSRFFFDTDTRFMKGKYIGMCDHKEHRGAFAFI
jgi:hypothetical protein